MVKTNKEKWYDQGIRSIFYALPVIIPVIFSPAFHTVFSAPKLLALRILTLAIFLLWGAKVFIEGRFNHQRGWLNTALISYGIISILTTIFSVAFYTSLYGAQGRFLGIFTIINLLILPLFVWNFLKKKEVVTMLKVSVGTASILGIYGIIQFFGIFQGAYNWSQAPAERVFGTIGHGNHFGTYLGMHLLLGLFLLPTLKEKKHKLLLSAGLLFQLVTLFLTASRGALAATAFALFIAGIVLAVKKWELVKRKIVRWALPVFITISIAAAAFIVLGDDLRKVPVIDRTISTIASVQEGNIPDRFSWWLSSIEMIKDKPLLGHGLSTYRDIYNQYRRTDYQTLEAGGQQDHITPEAAHNEYLTIAATQGLLGLAAFLAIIILIFWKVDVALFSKKEQPLFYPILGVKSAITAFLIQAIISFGVVTTLTFLYLFLGAGWVLTEDQSRTKEFKLKGVAKHLIAILLLIGISIAAIGTYREAMAEVHYKSGQISMQQGDLESATQSFDQMITAKPFEYAYYQAYGNTELQNSRSLGLTEDKKVELISSAILHYENALLVNNLHPSTYYNLGVAYMQIYAQTGNPTYYERASYNLNQAVAKAPNNPLYPYQSAKAFLAIETNEARQKSANLFEATLQIRTPYRDTEQALKQLQEVLRQE